MSYSVDFEECLHFLRSEIPLSRNGRIRLFANINSDLREHGEFYRKDASRRLTPDSDCFWYDLLLQDPPGSGTFHHVRFVVNDADAQYGVLRIMFVDHNVGP